jgi:O-antigen biosynthesis protein
MAGWDVSNWALPEGVINHGVVDVHRMNEIYNLCSAAFVMSLTNMSLLPFELMASGVVPIVNDGPNNRMVADHALIKYIDTASPIEAVNALIDSLDSATQVEESRELARAVEGYSWDNSAMQYEVALNELLYKQTKYLR